MKAMTPGKSWRADVVGEALPFFLPIVQPEIDL
jgi:hypothetical protein